MFKWKRSDFVEPRAWHSFQTNFENNEIEEFVVQDLPREKYEDAVNFMLEHFLSDEPICKSKDVLNDAEALEEVCKLWRLVLNQNVVNACFKKGCEDIVGLNMLCVITREDFKNFKLEVREDNTWKAVHDYALASFNLFKHYEFADKILIAYGLSVSKKYRQRGIATEILRARIPLCQHLGILLTSTVFTAIGSQKPAEKIGFQVNFEISYDKLVEYHKEFKFKNLGTSSLKLMSLVVNPE